MQFPDSQTKAGRIASGLAVSDLQLSVENFPKTH